MEESFKSLIELGEEIGLFVVQEENGEYIIDTEGLIKLKKEMIDIKRKNNEVFEFIKTYENTLTVSLI